MKRHNASCAVLAAGVAFLVGCGDENNTTEITQVVGMQVVEAGEALPKCTADNEGAMVYSVDSAEAFYCVSRKWTTMKGEKGEDGKKGTDGESGSAGADGKDGKDGKNGKDGSSCTAKALKDGKGYKIVCGGDSVGVVMSGAEGAQGIKGDSGAAGAAGLSAYEIAKAGGYAGTEEQWIESLKGDPGDPGVKGDSGVAGTSCTAEEDSAGGVKITCTDGKTFTLRNGADGKDYNGTEGVLIDPRDKQIYRVVTIGKQTWMAENLNYKTENSWCGGGSGKNEGDCSKYGRLYTWATAIDVCPKGWHLPDTTEWNALFAAVGGKPIVAKMLKSTEGWNDYEGTSGNGSDTYFFSALPAGGRGSSGGFYDEGFSAYFWSSTEYNGTTEYNSSHAYDLGLYYVTNSAGLGNGSKGLGHSVRCLRD